jgi:hypothetical protein
VIGLRLFFAALLISFAFVALGVAWWESSQREPGGLRAVGSIPGDYRPLQLASTAPPEVLSDDARYDAETRCMRAGGEPYTGFTFVSCDMPNPNKSWIYGVSDVPAELRGVK